MGLNRKFSMTPNNILAALLTVDGSGSLLDADMVDGEHAAAFADAIHDHDVADITDFPSEMDPTAHKTSHETGGSDALAASDIGAAEAIHDHDVADITDFPTEMDPTAHKSSHAAGGDDMLLPSDIGALALAGGTLTGALVLPGNPTAALQAASKGYVDGIAWLHALSEDTTLYVDATTGNDTTGDGSAAAPYATINKALAMTPKNLNGHTMTISIAAGTYAELARVDNYSAGCIILSMTGAAIISGGVSVNRATVSIDTAGGSLTLQYSSGVSNANGVLTAGEGGVILYGTLTVDCLSAAIPGISAVCGGLVYSLSISAVATVNNAGGSFAAFMTSRSGSLYIHNSAGTGNSNGYFSYGGLIRVGNDGITATTKVKKQMGGQVLTGAGVDLT